VGSSRTSTITSWAARTKLTTESPMPAAVSISSMSSSSPMSLKAWISPACSRGPRLTSSAAPEAAGTMRIPPWPSIITSRIGQGRLGSQTQLHIDIGQSEVCIHQHNAASQLGQCQGKVDRHVGLANAALASGDCNYLNRLIAHLYAALIQSLTCALCVKYTG